MRAARPVIALSVAAMLAGSPALAQTNTTVLEAVGERQIDSVTQTDEIGLKKDVYDRMTVPVRLAGAGPYRFIVDTGADRTAISRQIAARHDLAAGRGAQMHSISGASRVETAVVPRLDLSYKAVHDLEAALLESTNMGADGILGVDSLRSQRVVFDFQAQTMSIVPSAQRERDEPGTIVVRGRLRNGRLLLTNARADDQLLSVVIDTGAQVTVGNQALRRRLSRKGLLRRSGKVELQSVTGEKIVGDYMYINKLEIGGMVLKDLAIVFADAHTFKRLGMEKRPALLLGMNAMRAFDRVSIDFASKKMRVLLPEHSSLQNVMFASR